MGRDNGLEENSVTRDDEVAASNTVPFYKLFGFADSIDKILMIAGSIGAVGNGLCYPLLTLFYRDIVDAFGQTQSDHIVSAVSKPSLKIVYLAAGCGVASFLQMACWMTTGERQAARIRILYLKTILRQDVGFFDMETNTGEVVGRMSGDTVLIQDAMSEKVGKFIQYMSTFVGGFAIAFVRGWLLSVVMLSSLPLITLCGVMTSLVLSKMSSRGQNAYAKGAAVVEQTIGSIRTVASFSGEKEAVAEYDKYLVKAVESGVDEGWASGLGVGSTLFVSFCSYALAIWFGAKLILHKGYTGGDVLNVLLAVFVGAMNLGQASPCLTAFASGQAAAFKMFQTINRKPEIDAYDDGGRIMEDIRGDIELRDVYFSYPARPNEPIFRGFCLSISSGTTVALVGQSGSGKSTVISMIERFYDPQSGEVAIDGVNLKDLQLKWIRSKIGLVSQEPVLFTGSIKDNIAYGKNGATTEEIRAATQLANAAKFIDKLPQGLDTMVGERGTQLSGGQKQRIAIARAILKDPRILLLDEATSALDSESERIVQEALDRIMVDRTTVIVAHRLSTVRNANMIAVINQGKVVEKGTHFELLQDPDGAYSQLVHLQEGNRDRSEHGNEKEASDNITMDVPERQSSQKMSFLHSLSRGSSGMGNSIHHQSLPITFGLPVSVNVPDQSAIQNPDGNSSEKPPKVSIRRLAYLNKPEARFLMAGTVSAIIHGSIMPVVGILMSNAIKAFYEPPHKLRKDTKFWAIIFVLFALAQLIVCPIKSYMFGVAGTKLIRRIRLMCFEKVVNMEVGWFDEPDHSSGVIGARLSTNASMIRNLVGDGLAQIVLDISSVVAGLIIGFQASWQLTLITIGVMPLSALSGYIQLKSIMGLAKDAKAMYEQASQVANDAVGSIRTVASYCAEEKVVAIYRKKCEGPLRSGIKQGVVSGISCAFSSAIMYLLYALTFYAGARLVHDGKITFSDVFRVFLALLVSGTAISQSSVFVADSSKVRSAAASIFAILDRKSKIDPSDESGIKLDNVKGEIELRHVTFHYPTRPNVQILRDLSLTIHCGKSVALVGESGSGKSTVISLLQRFYDPVSGTITLDGTEIHQFQLKWLRQQMGLVSQEPVLFNNTIRANIAYGKEENVPEADIIAAAKLANAHTYISGLQQGYDTMVGERGVQLSGGQKQRIAIARAILKSPKILLLDEATSALDAESERIVQDALDQAMLNRTTVIVAHRLSTITAADTIAVMKNGVIVEKGKHETLININDGFYASLVALSTTTTA